MNRRTWLWIVMAVAALPAAAHAVARGETKIAPGGKTIAIDYGRPSLQGRDMIAQAQVGQVWRMGADAATTLKTDADLTFGDVKLPKGDYVLRAKKLGDEQWSLLVFQNNSQLAELPLVYEKLPESVETLTLELKQAKDGGDFTLSWGKAALKATFTAK